MPNFVAYAALVSWPLVTLALFRSLPPGRALIAAIVAGYLLLPPQPAVIDLPLIPDLGKEEMAALSAALVAMAFHRPGAGLLPESIVARWLIALFVLSPFATALTNPEPLFFGPEALPGLRLREGVSAVILQGIVVSPLLLGRYFLSRARDQRDLLLALMIGGLVYSLPVLAEVRLSPQINTWVYGYFQHSFDQMMRDGGFRPIVFLYHALWVSFFLMTALVAAAAIARGMTGRIRLMILGIAGWLAVTLVLGKSYASIFYAIALVPLVLVMSPRLQLHIAAIIAVVALAYPLARSIDIVPTDRVVALAGEMGADRAHTLKYRFDNEGILAQRAWIKPVFGWGQWGRNHVFSPSNGEMLSVTDGHWVLVLGVFGFAGLVGTFGLLALPVLTAWRRRGDIVQSEGALWIAALALILAVNLFDLIPNATITPLTWLFAGTILGALERLPKLAHSRQYAPIRTVL